MLECLLLLNVLQMNTTLICVISLIGLYSYEYHRRGKCNAQLGTFSWCTCARESASAPSQHQQAVFHRAVAEAREIRAESTKNNPTEPRDNPEPKHQRDTGGHPSSGRESAPKKNTGTGRAAIVRPRGHRGKRRM